MRLSTLTLSGFKSFARATTFEFPSAVSAVVGPNGSGKSNVAEAIRWVLGEQSMKTLRGKKGEDLIFNGSASAPRMGKASVTLTFDNRDRALALDFNEAIVERKIFRDGTNEYFLNGSPVRLRDIVELLARIGLGSSQHNIIGQGEVDRILLASPRDRKLLLEEAMGLRFWQLKKRESERKLEETARNVTQAKALAQEISPHLKFLKSQADKAEKHEVIRKELEDYYRAAVAKEGAGIAAEAERLRSEAEPIKTKQRGLEEEIARLSRELQEGESAPGSAEALRAQEGELETLEARRRELERGLGRIEGRLESSREPPPGQRAVVELAAVAGTLEELSGELRRAIAINALDDLKARITGIAERLERFLAELTRGGRPASTSSPAGTALEAERSRLQRELKDVERDLAGRRARLGRAVHYLQQVQAALRERFERRREREEEAALLRTGLQRIAFDEEKLALRRQDLTRMIEESGLSGRELEAPTSPFLALEPNELRRKIEKLRVRLEEIGGIDPAVLKEYQETKARHDFLERELEDLTQAGQDLRGLIAELEERIEHDFREGLTKIKAEFHRYFRIIFGGGKGVVSYIPIQKAAPGEASASAEAGDGEVEYGIDIDVDLPRKRIKGLAMLSGGERALVSVALLFAITAVNPPPFLVLDETDAALDEANSQKYAAILKELSKKTQLILITHNRETMKQAGILYGVTMGEDGISKILSLKLEEAESYGNR